MLQLVKLQPSVRASCAEGLSSAHLLLISLLILSPTFLTLPSLISYSVDSSPPGTSHSASSSLHLSLPPLPFISPYPLPLLPLLSSLQVDRQKYAKAVKQCLFNMVVLNLVFGLASYPFVAWRGPSCGYDIPSFPSVLLHLAVFILVEEIGFYYAHRLVTDLCNGTL